MTNNENCKEELMEDIKENLTRIGGFSEESPTNLKDALVTDILSSLRRYEYLRTKFKSALDNLRDLSRDGEDENGVRSQDLATQIYYMEQTMAEAIGLYGRIFMLDNILSYIERKPKLADLIWKYKQPESILSKSDYLEEEELDLLHSATRRKKITKIMDKYEGLMPYMDFQSETMDSEDFRDEFIRRGKLRF